MTIATIRQTIRVSDVSDIVVSAIEDSDVAGRKLRAIRVYGPGGTEAQAIFELQVESDDPTKIRLTTPEIDF